MTGSDRLTRRAMLKSATGGLMASSFGTPLVWKADHWIYQGTGLQDGDRIPAVIGWEYHGPQYAEMDGLEIVAESPVQCAESHDSGLAPIRADSLWKRISS